MTQQALPMRRMSPIFQAAPLVALLALVLAPFAAAQSASTGVGPVDDTSATVAAMLNNTLNPPPGNGTNPPPPSGNATPPAGNGTNPPGNGTQPPGNGTGGNATTPGNNTTSPPGGNRTAPGNQTASHGNQTAGNATAPGNSTAPPGNGTTAAGGSTQTGAVADNTTVQGAGLVAGPGTSNEAERQGGFKAPTPCQDALCQRSRPLSPPPLVKAGFPWMPLLLTLTLAPLVGLVAARHAIKRWQGQRPAKKGNAYYGEAAVKGPADAHDPMRKFLMDVKEWRAMPMPGTTSEEAV